MINKLGHVTRKLNRQEPLTGKVLETALEAIDESRKGFSDEKFLDNISKKLVSGRALDDYEYHIMVDVLLTHRRLSE